MIHDLRQSLRLRVLQLRVTFAGAEVRASSGSWGEDHPDTLSSRNNLAGACWAAGDPGRAIPMYERALADFMRVLGEDHPRTLTVRSNLATVRQGPP